MNGIGVDIFEGLDVLSEKKSQGHLPQPENRTEGGDSLFFFALIICKDRQRQKRRKKSVSLHF